MSRREMPASLALLLVMTILALCLAAQQPHDFAGARHERATLSLSGVRILAERCDARARHIGTSAPTVASPPTGAC